MSIVECETGPGGAGPCDGREWVLLPTEPCDRFSVCLSLGDQERNISVHSCEPSTGGCWEQKIKRMHEDNFACGAWVSFFRMGKQGAFSLAFKGVELVGWEVVRSEKEEFKSGEGLIFTLGDDSGPLIFFPTVHTPFVFKGVKLDDESPFELRVSSILLTEGKIFID